MRTEKIQVADPHKDGAYGSAAQGPMREVRAVEVPGHSRA